MTSAKDVLGEIIKLGMTIIFAAISMWLSILLPSGTLARLLHVTTIPCLGLGLLAGPLYVLWISLAYRICGPWHGVITSIFTSSLMLLSGPWYGVTDPSWFGLYGLISFIMLGLLTERVNGGLASMICLIINWLGLGIHTGIWPKPLHITCLVLVITFFSGLVFDKLASIIAGKTASMR